MKQIRSIRAAWRNTSCTKASKLGKIFDTITEHTHQLLRLYMPSDNSEEMLSAILGLYGRENTTEDIFTIFNTTQQAARQTVVKILLRLHKIFEQVKSAQEADGDPPKCEEVLNKQLIKVV